MYNITLGQLIVVWVFGGFLAFISGLKGLSEGDILFALFLPAFVWGAMFFYTFGWRARRRDLSEHHSDRSEEPAHDTEEAESEESSSEQHTQS